MSQNTTQTMCFVPPSTKSIYISDQSRTSSGSSSPFRSQSLSRSLTAPHTPTYSPVELHKARIESTFRTIEYVNFRDKPACLIVIDVRFIYNKKYQMRSANIQLTFSKDLDGSTDDASFPRTTDAYGPTDGFGGVESVSNTHNVGLTTPRYHRRLWPSHCNDRWLERADAKPAMANPRDARAAKARAQPELQLDNFRQRSLIF